MKIRQFLFYVLLFFSNQLFAQSNTDTLLVGYTPTPPFIIDENNHLGGISVWLWQHSAKELNLNYKLVPMAFEEMLDSVKSGGIDVSINPLTITSQRLKQMNFTHPFFASHSIVVRGHLSAFEQIKVFFNSLFSISFLNGFLALMILIGIFGVLVWYFEKEVNPQNFRKGWKGLWDGLWWSVVTMTTVGYGDKTPQSRGGKIVALIWMFSGLLFISGLTASVASTLTIDRLSSDSSELDDFKSKTIGTIKQSGSEQLLKDHFFRNIRFFNNLSAGLDALASHQIEAFVYDEPIIRYRLMNDPKHSELIVLPAKFRTEFYAFALPQKHAALRDLLSQKIFNITERLEWQTVLNEYGCGDK